MIQVAVDEFQALMKQTLGGQLLAIYLYGSYLQDHYDPTESDVNVIAVVTDNTSLHICRDAIVPFWQKYQQHLHLPPLIVRESSFARHLRLNPILSYHLKGEGKHVFGKALVPMNFPPPKSIEEIAYYSARLMDASMALASDLLIEEQAEDARKKLRRLARQLNHQQLKGDETVSQLFAQVQVSLQGMMEEMPQAKRFNQEHVVNSVTDSNLRAIYQETDAMVIIIPEMIPSLLQAIQWDEITARLKDRCHAIVVTTSDQLRLAICYESPIDFALGRYSHMWGQTPLEGLEISPAMLYRAAARMPSGYLVQNFCHSYLVAENEEGIHKAIHDLQNRLLNIQLQHELLRRFGIMEAAKPPMPLPKRGTAFAKRIDAIYYHLDWWADYYSQKLMASPPFELSSV